MVVESVPCDNSSKLNVHTSTMMPRLLIGALAAVSLVTLIACTAPEIRPELGVMTSSIDEVWEAFVEVTKQWGFVFEIADSSKYLLRGTRDSTTVIGGSVSPYERFGKATRQEFHIMRVQMSPRGDQSTVIEIIYLIDKIPDAEAGFALLNAVRERLAARNR
jgi:hypothetical protein